MIPTNDSYWVSVVEDRRMCVMVKNLCERRWAESAFQIRKVSYCVARIPNGKCSTYVKSQYDTLETITQITQCKAHALHWDEVHIAPYYTVHYCINKLGIMFFSFSTVVFISSWSHITCHLFICNDSNPSWRWRKVEGTAIISVSGYVIAICTLCDYIIMIWCILWS